MLWIFCVLLLMFCYVVLFLGLSCVLSCLFVYYLVFFFFIYVIIFFFFFFFQAEDGIRDHCVTGVQTCALPISRFFVQPLHVPPELPVVVAHEEIHQRGHVLFPFPQRRKKNGNDGQPVIQEIGRASCRERV